jgi:hypothetical protein
MPSETNLSIIIGRLAFGYRLSNETCESRDSNPDGLPHWILSPARLPIPPLSRASVWLSLWRRLGCVNLAAPLYYFVVQPSRLLTAGETPASQVALQAYPAGVVSWK